MKIDKLVNHISPKRLFLMDSLGALGTALMLGFVLTRFDHLLGMPKIVLYSLSGIAFGFSIFSFLCYLKIKANEITFLRGIAIANLMYCILTIGLVIYLRSTLTHLGFIYFLTEALIILSLVVFELKVVSVLAIRKAKNCVC